ncbi:MAG: acetoacetate--CoA ligase [Dehalococcoidia bacterium]
MKSPLWQPSEERKANSSMAGFMGLVNARHATGFCSYDELYDWSVNNIRDFWAAVWDFTGIKASRSYDSAIDDVDRMPGARWFGGARLNFAENLLRHRDNRIALIFRGEKQRTASMTYAELYDAVARLAKSLRQMGLRSGDRVAGYMPNMMETIISMLAATSIGAAWASCATDIGLEAAVDRLGQIAPKVLFTVDGYFYKGKHFDSLSNAAGIAERTPSIEKVIVASYTGQETDISRVPSAVHYADFVAEEADLEIQFEQLAFDHPLYIMFSSGTTGKPKCMVQGAGGILVNHLKELMLHTDLKRDDVLFYITTCSWMMWNWMVSSLAVGNTLVLYDGNPNYPDAGAMWQLLQDEKVTVFGCSASYINYLKGQGMKPGSAYHLSSLREISQTGSPLSAEGFGYVYRHIKQDLWFNSIAGGTDINGCFCAGNPISPVYAGELQGPALGMKVNVYDEAGNPVVDCEGELVCEAPSPSMPLYFWNDPDGRRYREAYFEVYPGVWRHGDYVIRHSDTGGFTFCGRSDSVLKPSGVRIGTAEIYNQVERLGEVVDSLAIGQNREGDQRIILFVKLAQGCDLTDDLRSKIVKTLRENASPRHIPARIIQVPDIPYTLNMKKVESAVTNIVHGRPVLNRDALCNPQCLDCYEKLISEGVLQS